MSDKVIYQVTCFSDDTWPDVYDAESLANAVKLLRSAGDIIDVIEDDKTTSGTLHAEESDMSNMDTKTPNTSEPEFFESPQCQGRKAAGKATERQGSVFPPRNPRLLLRRRSSYILAGE